MAQNSDTAGPSYTFFHDCRKSSVTSYDPCANLNNLATGNRRTLLYQECFLSVIRSQDLLYPYVTRIKMRPSIPQSVR